MAKVKASSHHFIVFFILLVNLLKPIFSTEDGKPENRLIFCFLFNLFFLTFVVICSYFTLKGSTLQSIYFGFDTQDFLASNTWQDSTGDNDVDPCTGWAYVRCDENSRITTL